VVPERDALGELTALSEELGLYEEPPRACVTHGSVYVCRRKGGCEWSSDPDVVRRVMRGQLRAAAAAAERGETTDRGSFAQYADEG
jgi:hypothetical protein